MARTSTLRPSVPTDGTRASASLTKSPLEAYFLAATPPAESGSPAPKQPTPSPSAPAQPPVTQKTQKKKPSRPATSSSRSNSNSNSSKPAPLHSSDVVAQTDQSRRSPPVVSTQVNSQLGGRKRKGGAASSVQSLASNDSPRPSTNVAYPEPVPAKLRRGKLRGIYYVVLFDPFYYLFALPQVLANDWVYSTAIWMLNAAAVCMLSVVMILTHPIHKRTCCQPPELSGMSGHYGSCAVSWSAMSIEARIRGITCSTWSGTDLILLVLGIICAIVSLGIYIWRCSHNVYQMEFVSHKKWWIIALSPVSFLLGTPAHWFGAERWRTFGYHLLMIGTVLCSLATIMSFQENRTFGCYKSTDPYEFKYGTCTNSDALINDEAHAALRRSRPLLGYYTWIIGSLTLALLTLVIWIYVMFSRNLYRYLKYGKIGINNIVIGSDMA